MRLNMTLLACVLALGATAACKKKKTEDANPPQGSAGSAAMAPDAGSMATPTGDAGGAAGGNEMTKRAGNCPSTVWGATTKSELKDNNVILTITSDDKDAVLSIQRRTEELLAEKKDGGGGAVHDQKGTHGGGVGLCPVFFGEGGTATSAKIDNGVTITITPKDKPEELKTTIDGRIAKSDEWVKANLKPADQGNSGGVGGGEGEHGGNHSGQGDSKGKERKDGTGGGAGTGGGGGKGTGGGDSDKKDAKTDKKM